MNKKILIKESRAAEAEKLLEEAQHQLPGITELVEAYGNFEEMILLVQEYLDMTKPQLSTATSNQSDSDP